MYKTLVIQQVQNGFLVHGYFSRSPCGEIDNKELSVYNNIEDLTKDLRKHFTEKLEDLNNFN